MSFALPPIGRPDIAPPPAPTQGTSPAAFEGAQIREKAPVEPIPSTPPAQVFREMQDASRRVEELRASDRALHFEKDPGDGHVKVEVRDGNGTLIRVIPPSEALAVISGAGLE